MRRCLLCPRAIVELNRPERALTITQNSILLVWRPTHGASGKLSTSGKCRSRGERVPAHEKMRCSIGTSFAGSQLGCVGGDLHVAKSSDTPACSLFYWSFRSFPTVMDFEISIILGGT